MSEPTLGDDVKSQMNRIDIHDYWEDFYRTPGNEQLFEDCYDYIVGVVNQPEGSRALDIGCGICANSLRLARRGYRVEAGDYSEPILEHARENVSRQGMSDRINITRQDITKLDHPDDSFDLTLCWGVLMHIPDVDDAISELVRVTKPGGFIAFEEVNVRSPESRALRLFWRLQNLYRDKKYRFVEMEFGLNHIVTFRDEELFWRQVDPKRFAKRMEREGLRLVAQRAGMCTESHLALPRSLQAPGDALNRYFHKSIGSAALSRHVICVFKLDS